MCPMLDPEIPLRRIAAVLVAAGALIAGVGYLAASTSPDRTYELLPRSSGMAPRGITWNVSPIEAPDEMPVYRLEENSQSAHDAVRIALALGMDPDELTYDLSQRTYWVEETDPRATLHVSDAGKEISYHRDTTYAGIAEHPPELPGDAEAVELARAFLERADLMPPGEHVATPPRVFIDERLGHCDTGDQGNATDGSCTFTNVSKSVRYERLVDGYPAIYGTSLAVGLGDEGRIREVSVQWEPIGQIDTEPVVGFEDAYRDARSMGDDWWQAPGGCERPEITTARLGYFFPERDSIGEPWGPSGPWVFPVYLFEGTCEDVDETRPYSGITIAVPAVG